MTDEQLYPRYFRYVKAWDRCLSDGKWPAAIVEQYPDPFPPRMSETQRGIVTQAAQEWTQPSGQFGAGVPAMGSVSSTGFSTATFPGTTAQRVAEPMTWARMQQMTEQRKLLAARRAEVARLAESRLQDLRLRMGKTAFHEFEDYVHQLYHAIPGKLEPRPATESVMYSKYFLLIASMDKFAAGGGEDGAAAAKARADEQSACKLSDKDEAILQQVADDFHKEVAESGPVMMSSTTGSVGPGRPAIGSVRVEDMARMRESRGRIFDAHMEQLMSELGEESFEKVERRVHTLYESDGLPQVVPIADFAANIQRK